MTRDDGPAAEIAVIALVRVIADDASSSSLCLSGVRSLASCARPDSAPLHRETRQNGGQRRVFSSPAAHLQVAESDAVRGGDCR